MMMLLQFQVLNVDQTEPYVFTPTNSTDVLAWVDDRSSGDIVSARLYREPSLVPSIELEAQDLSTVATISQANLVVGTVDAIELEGQNLTASITITEANAQCWNGLRCCA